jgi:hypothetical protein
MALVGSHRSILCRSASERSLSPIRLRRGGISSRRHFEAMELGGARNASLQVARRGEAREMFFYRFDLRDFDEGCFTAVRFPGTVSDPPPGDWTCRALNDSHALELARRAAVEEWPEPTGRGPLDFIVRFTEP